MNNTTMCLVWHNCKTCPPTEKYNDNLLMWDGYELDRVEWDNGSRWCRGRPLSLTGEEELCWWADLALTTKRFFNLDLGMKESSQCI